MNIKVGLGGYMLNYSEGKCYTDYVWGLFWSLFFYIPKQVVHAATTQSLYKLFDRVFICWLLGNFLTDSD